MLEYCWLFALLLRSARYFPGAEGKWIPLPPMLPPSSPGCSPGNYFSFKFQFKCFFPVKLPNHSCPRPKLLDWLINSLLACQGPHLQNSEECDPGRKKSETNPSNHRLPLHRQDNSRNNLNGLKPTEDFFFPFFFPFFFLFFFPFPFPLNSFFLSLSFFSFIPSSSHPLPFLCLLPAFFYLFLCFNFC